MKNYLQESRSNNFFFFFYNVHPKKKLICFGIKYLD